MKTYYSTETETAPAEPTTKPTTDPGNPTTSPGVKPGNDPFSVPSPQVSPTPKA